VRAGMVDHPSEYPWSSYAYSAVGKANSMLSPHDLYLQLGDNDAARQNSYRALFDRTMTIGCFGSGRNFSYNGLLSTIQARANILDIQVCLFRRHDLPLVG